MSLQRALRYRLSALAAAALVSATATSASAQAPAPDPAEADDPNPGSITMTAGLDVVNAYMFRGIKQEATDVISWPYLDLGVALWSADEGALRSVGLNLGAWNSLHAGATGVAGPSGKLWYEGDFYGSLALGFAGGVSLGTTYTAYTSPNNSFSTVKEMAFKLGIDDTPLLGVAAVRPYALVALEIDTAPGAGQADAGSKAGRYLEVGAAPGWAVDKLALAFPMKVGMSLGDYYELNTGTVARPVFVDNRFGFFSVAGIVTVPLGGTTRAGTWNIHGGVEYQALGNTTKVINGKSSRTIGSFGFGVVY